MSCVFFAEYEDSWSELINFRNTFEEEDGGEITHARTNSIIDDFINVAVTGCDFLLF